MCLDGAVLCKGILSSLVCTTDGKDDGKNDGRRYQCHGEVGDHSKSATQIGGYYSQYRNDNRLEIDDDQHLS